MPRPAAAAAAAAAAPAAKPVDGQKKKLVAKKTPGTKKLLGKKVVARGARPLSERAQRIRDDPMSGFSSRRMVTMALWHGIMSMSSEAKDVVRSIVNDGVEAVLDKALLLATSDKKQTLRAQDVEAAYAFVAQVSPRLYMAKLCDDRESVSRALNGSKATRRAKHTTETA